MSVPGRVADYDSIAAGYDRRYDLHAYAGVADALRTFTSSPEISSALEVGCGTGHWLVGLGASVPHLAGVEPSPEMLARARRAAPHALLARARAEALPWRDGTFDRIFCVNALHHFADRTRFFVEARRILRPGGAMLSIGKDPHTDRDSWWVYDYFPETLAIDRERFARVRTLRGEIATAGFDWTESFEVDRIEAVIPAAEALSGGVVDRAYTSQLAVLSNDEFDAGVARIRSANDAAQGELQLVTDFRLYATIGWIQPVSGAA